MDRLGFARSWDDRVVRSELIECAQLMGDDPEWLKSVMSTPFNLSITVTHLPGGSEQVIGPADPDVTEMTEIVQMRRLATVEEPGGETHLATIDLRLYRPIR